MKSNELQIGDWVNVTSKFVSVCENGAATSNTISNIETRAAKVNFLTNKEIFTDASTIREFLLEPIPLTAEILEKNGWNELSWKDVKYHTGLTTAYKRDDYTIQIGYNELINMYDIFNGFVSFKTVHQLQHALRLCGLNELADNFEI